MLQITEDTPPDMLAGAMDLIVHLPNGNSVKMSVERSTPMMDLLVQITTNHHLQLSGYTLQPLEMASSSTGYCNDKILPFKPNTPIGVLDTQHIRVVPKIKTIPKTIQKNPSILTNHYNNNSNNLNNNNNINNNNHQPFESTFRLKIYLPRNQLYVIRISQNVYLEEILKKVCDEKHLDPQKYEFRHPGNLDEILDPKLTLSDYQITEIHLVSKGTIGLQQHTFPSSDLMALRKEEERKQMLHNKTGGGVFNLIFRRGKTTSGSVSSENRSISPTHSDDSCSVTPPGVVSSPIPTTTTTTTVVTQQKEEKPKAPQRKRRPAPKPPQIIDNKDTPATATKEVETTKKLETGLTICHSRNSSDSSGYHEASVLSDNCGNMSLPRRPKSTTIETDDCNNNNNKNRRIIGKFSQSTSNLTKMSIQSKSTSSLIIAGRKKKTAPPPPPPVVVKQTESNNIDKQQPQQQQPPSPVVASQTTTTTTTTNTTTKDTENRTIKDGDGPVVITNPNPPIRLLHNAPKPAPRNKISNTPIDNNSTISSSASTIKSSIENKIELNLNRDTELKPENCKETNEAINENLVTDTRNLTILINNNDNKEIEVEAKKLPEVIEAIPKQNTQTMFDSLTRKRGFQIGSSLLNDNNNNSDEIQSTNNDTDDDLITDDELFNGSLDTNTQNNVLNQLHGIHDYDNKLKPLQKNLSVTSLRSVTSIPGFMGNTNMKKWNNIEELDDISMQSVQWVIGDDKKTDAISIQKLDEKIDNKPISVIESSCEKTEFDNNPNKEEINNTNNSNNDGNDFETDWQYQLPSPPKAFRDSSPTLPLNSNDNLTRIDSVVTSPELFEKLQTISDNRQDDKFSNFSDIDDRSSILNKLSLENLEKRKSLVYNRELTTSLKEQEQDGKIETHTKTDEDYVETLMKFEKTLDELQQKTTSSQQQQRPQQKKETITKSTLPNFKITTYDNPKQKLNIFEDDTVRSNRKADNNTTQLRRNSNDNNNNNNGNGKSSNLFRTESFQQNYWSPIKLVTRSKSSVALNKYNNNNNSNNYGNIDNNSNDNIDKHNKNDENLTKSNSLFDVSGLQSLGVMRLIQSKLNTPRNSVGENLNIDHSLINSNKNHKNYQKQSDNKIEVQNTDNISNNSNNNINNKTEKSYQYITTTPSINMGTWSERPKIPVNVKEDPDYKISNNHNDNNNNNRRISPVFKINNNNGVNLRINSEYKNVSIKVNGSEPISAENSGNVVIKIGEQQQPNRKPLGSVNKIDKQQRPHSTAFDSDFDTSRLPVVRSVELKKPYKDLQNNNNNTTITQINDKPNTYRNSETLQQKQQIEPKFRLNSFVQNSAPVVRGFRTNQDNNNHRFSWNHQPHSYSSSTLALKNKEKSSSTTTLDRASKLDTISSTFRVNLRRTESTKINDLDKKIVTPPPPPPPLQPTKSTKFVKNSNNGVDPKEQLLQAIRDFGGKKGLRTVKA